MTTPTASTLKVEWWPIEKPLPYARNARVCPESAISKVAGSIHEFGFKNPILVDGEGVIIAGHTRLLAAQRLALETVPVIVCADLSPEQVKALRLADNRTGEETSWDEELLPLELAELAGLDFELALTGFEPDELAAFLAEETEGLTDADAVPDLPEEPVSQPGDLYLLGEHRLLCGDATSAADVQRVMDGKKATLMATDPPYLVDYDGGNHPQTWGKDGRAISSEEKTKHWDAYEDPETASAFFTGYLSVALSEALVGDAAVYQCFASMRSEIVLAAWRAVGLLPHQMLVWRKSRPVLTRCWFMWDFEPILVGWPRGHQPKMKPPNNERAVWEIATSEGVEDGVAGTHPTIKPVELIRRPIVWHTKPGGLIYEPFSGSGTAIIAAEQTGRTCYALEQSPQFVDVAVARWEAFTGRKAERG